MSSKQEILDKQIVRRISNDSYELLLYLGWNDSLYCKKEAKAENIEMYAPKYISHEVSINCFILVDVKESTLEAEFKHIYKLWQHEKHATYAIIVSKNEIVTLAKKLTGTTPTPTKQKREPLWSQEDVFKVTNFSIVKKDLSVQ